MANGTGTELVKHDPTVSLTPYSPDSYGQALEMAATFTGSKLTRCRTREQTYLVMATGAELGIPVTTALRMVYVADFGQGDQITLSADLMVALCLRSPLCEYFRCAESSDDHATYVTKRKGDPERQQTFTVADQQRAKLGAVGAGKDAASTNWAKYPATMLRHRAAAMLAREVYPDVIGGFYTDDEAREMVRDVGPQVATPVSPLPSGPKIVDAEVVAAASPESLDAKVARWEGELRAAPSEASAAKTIKAITAEIKDKNDPHRVALKKVLDERKAAGWAVAGAAAAMAGELAHDFETGEIRQPGEEG